VPQDDLFRRLFDVACERDLTTVLAATLDLVIDESRAERGFVVTLDGGSLEVRAARGLDGAEVTGPDMSPSRTVVREAVQAKRPVRVARALETRGLSEQESVAQGRLQSILAVPVVDGGIVVAVVCVDSTRKDAFTAATEAALSGLSQPLGRALRNAARFTKLERQTKALVEKVGDDGGVLGQAPTFLAALRAVRRVATADVPVLLLGETGTGKEVMAREVHRCSARRERPFVAVNCAALPAELLEAELFGHTAGAFTGATKARAGRFAAAEGGTLFLDEVGELGASAQARFLRALESGELQRVGDDKPTKADVRVVAATNRDLQDPATGFRSDLYYRLAVVSVRLPPLRDRREDVPLLAEAFCLEAAIEQGRPVEGLTPAAREALLRHAWPGNVRELKNAIRHATIFCHGALLEEDDLPEHVRAARGAPKAGAAPRTLEELQEAKRLATLEVERAFAARLLDEAGGNVAQAARLAGLSRPAFYDLLSRAGLDPATFRRG
jgi:two-component system response regulator HydG